MIQSLPPPNTLHLKAAEGWLELGNHLEASEELEQIAPSLRSHPDVLQLRWQIYAKELKWDACFDIAEALVKLTPDRPFGWIFRSVARYSQKRYQEAWDLLEPAADLFPGSWHIRYDLVCYACLLGNTKEAWELLEDAFELGDPKKLKLMALEDPDLEKFWAEIGRV